MTDPSDPARPFVDAATRTIEAVRRRPKKGSPRATETAELRRSPGGGGVARSHLLTDLNDDSLLLATRLAAGFAGVSDLVRASEPRDWAMHAGALNLVCRSLAETGGILAWLLDPGIAALERLHRHICWRLSDFQSQRHLVLAALATTTAPSVDAAVHEMNQIEAAYCERVRAAHFTIRERASNMKGPKLIRDNVAEGVPSKTSLVDDLLLPPSYALMSASAHGARHSLMRSIEVRPDGYGGTSLRVGDELDPALLLRIATTALLHPLQLAARWNGLDDTPVRSGALSFLRTFGIEPSMNLPFGLLPTD